jgi:PBP1b-binding outer membrane lipoprotein LpoB
MKIYSIIAVPLFMLLVGCASMCDPVVKVVKEPYPVLTPIPCVQSELPPELVLETDSLPDNVDWAGAVDAVVRDNQLLRIENEALRKELEACGKPIDIEQ